MAGAVGTVVVLTGYELGIFETTSEGQKQLREAAKLAFEDLLNQWLPCPALQADVQIRKTGIKKILSFSADSRKLKIIPKLKELIAVSEKIKSALPTNPLLEANTKAYHYLRANAELAGQAIMVRFVIREDDKGAFHYDHTLDPKDGSNKEKSPDFSGL
jgi:hypothetical protein